MAWGWRPDDRLILALPLFHVHGLCAGLFGTLAAGGSAVVFERFVPDHVLDAVPGSTMFFGVPTMYHRLAESGRADELSALAALRRRIGPPLGRSVAAVRRATAGYRCSSATGCPRPC